MKKALIPIIAILGLAITAWAFALPVTGITVGGPAWAEYEFNPIFGEASGGPKAYYPSVLRDEGSFSGHGVSARYKMWYGTSGSQTGLAVSDNGINWTDLGVVMSDGYHATVEYYADGFAGSDTGTSPSSDTMYYRMWYWDYPTLYDVSAIGYTESTDGLNWYNYQSCRNGAIPIVTGGNVGWNRGSYGPSDILYNPGASNSGTDWTFTMYYDGTPGGSESVGLGFSADGVTWTGYDANDDGKADPVLSGTYTSGDWDEDYVSRATVIKNADDDYEMWYSGGVGAMNNGIGYATSPDGINWTRDVNNPVLHKNDVGYPGEPWRQERTYCPMVVRDGSIYRMWFSGKGDDGYSIGHATGPAPAPPWHYAYLPLVQKDHVAAPDLMVQSIIATSNSVQVAIKNQGDSPVVDEFWVDVYIDPDPAPIAVNQVWHLLGDQGLVWGVTESALPGLAPGSVLTLTVDCDYYRGDFSEISWPLPPNTPIYAQVDSANTNTEYGGVLESHEIAGQTYNNIIGPVFSDTATTKSPASDERHLSPSNGLPAR